MSRSPLVFVADRFLLDRQVLAARLNRAVLTESPDPQLLQGLDLCRVDLVLLDAQVDGAVLVDAQDRAAAVGLLHDEKTPVTPTRAADPRVRLVASRAVPLDDLVLRILDVVAGGTQKAAAVPAPTTGRVPVLSPRESEVLRLLARGLGNRDIATELSISPHTVRTHVQAVLAKLDRGSRVAAVGAARQAGLLAK